MKKIMGLLDEVQEKRNCRELSLTGIFLIVLLICLLQPCNASAEYVYDNQWGMLGIYSYNFTSGWGVAVDSSGNIYVAYMGDGAVKKFTSDGTLLEMWGLNGKGDDTLFNARGVAVDSSGNVYVSALHEIRKYTASGTYVTQWGTNGTGNGQFDWPYGVAVDSSGNVYMADSGNNRIQKFTSNGTYVTQWGIKGAGNGQFQSPTGVAVDGSGNVYVTDTGNHRIQKFTSSGTYLTQWGTYGKGNGQFDYPIGVALDTLGNVYVVDGSDFPPRIQKFTSSGAYLTWWRLYTSPMAAGVAVDSSGNVYVTDVDMTVGTQKYTSSGTLLTEWDACGTGDVESWTPSAIAVALFHHPNWGNLTYVHVADIGNHRIQKFIDFQGGEYLYPWGTYGNGKGQFNDPHGVAVDNSGDVYVADTGNHRIQRFTVGGNYRTGWGTYGTGDGQFASPTGVAVDSLGGVYVADTGNHRVQKFTAAGTYLTQWGSYGSGDGQLASPTAVAVDSSGNIYVVDTGNHRVQKFTAAGTYLTQWGSYGSGDGQFTSPSAIAVDSSGNVYVADTGNHRIQKFDTSGTGVMDVWGTYGTGDGQFASPTGVAVDSEGKVYVVDKGNHRIQEFRYQVPPAPPAPPVLGTLTPSVLTSGENVAQFFSAVYSDGNGYWDLKHVYLKIGSLINGIVVVYSRTTGHLYLVNDAGKEYVGNCRPGEAITLTNSQGILDCGLTTVSGSGNDLTVNWTITPKASFAGTKHLYLYARDNADLTAGWEDKGDWTITSPSAAAPTLGDITPSVVTSGENEAQSFSAVYSDENGYSNLKHVYLKVGSLVNGMVAIYYTWVNKLYLVNDAGTGYVGNCIPGVAGTLTNSQGTLDCGLTTVSRTGNDLTVNWNTTPKASFAGTKPPLPVCEGQC